MYVYERKFNNSQHSAITIDWQCQLGTSKRIIQRRKWHKFLGQEKNNRKKQIK